MIKLDFTLPIKNIAGIEMQQTAWEITSGLLSMLPKVKDPIQIVKLDILARKIYNDKIIEVDASDCNLIKKYVEEDEQLVVFAKSHILQLIEDAEKAAKKEGETK